MTDPPRVGDHVRATGRVVELVVRSGIPGAVVHVGGLAAPVWLPISVLTVTMRGGSR